ncbi:hypothetical protein DRJ48_00810 [Candidatus Woesearchaeota archaeon]|nr:hypothetical protein [Candidatus Woesearchaeota archaeon]RLE43482.1 MAG: hypothetical protein DRJ48_00810 [Candidatus Woesearchaeota archaeon]
MFVRTKRVKGNEYAYLVKSVWTKQGPRQRVVRYIGRVFKPKKVHNIGVEEYGGMAVKELAKEDIQTLLTLLVERELSNHGFQRRGKQWVLDGCVVKPSIGAATINGHNIAVRMNEGFLCRSTIRALKRVLGKDKLSGHELASAFLEAGIDIDKQLFVLLYQRLMPHKQS